MKKTEKTIIYVDAANLNGGISSLGKKIDYSKFYRWLIEKYQADDIFLFIGFLQTNKSLYDRLKQVGFKIIFKKTYKTQENKIKGNCDAELVLVAVRDFYEQNLKKTVLLSGDGDFSCLIDFWKEKNLKCTILAPIKRGCSLFLRRKNVPVVFLEDLIHKIEKPPREPEV